MNENNLLEYGDFVLALREVAGNINEFRLFEEFDRETNEKISQNLDDLNKVIHNMLHVIGD